MNLEISHSPQIESKPVAGVVSFDGTGVSVVVVDVVVGKSGVIEGSGVVILSASGSMVEAKVETEHC